MIKSLKTHVSIFQQEQVSFAYLFGSMAKDRGTILCTGINETFMSLPAERSAAKQSTDIKQLKDFFGKKRLAMTGISES